MLQLPQKTKSYKLLIIVASTVLLVVFTTLVCLKLYALFNDKHQTNLVLVDITKGSVVSSVKAYGRLNTRGSNTHIARVGGTILDIHAFPGESIQVGQPIFTLVNPEIERKVELAKLDLLRAKADAERVDVNLLREDIELNSQLKLSQSAVRFAEKEFETMAVLTKENIVSQLDYLRSETNFEQAKQKLDQISQSIHAFDSASSSQKRIAQYEVDIAQSKLQLVESDFSHLNILAKATGIINEFADDFKKGALIQQGEPLFEVSDSSATYATLLVTATDAQYITLGQSVEILFRQIPYKGRVTRIFPKVENNQVTIEVDLNEPLDSSNINNIEVAGSITVAEVTDALVLRTPSSVNKQQSELIVHISEGDTFYKRTLKLGVIGAESVQVLNGASVGQQVVFNLPRSLLEQDVVLRSELNYD